MNLIAEQPYIKVERQVSSIEQKDVEEKRILYLYQDKVKSKHREFPIDDVLDMSYRKLGGDGGLLYLHTSHGVYSYTVKTSPMIFINQFKKYIKNEE